MAITFREAEKQDMPFGIIQAGFYPSQGFSSFKQAQVIIALPPPKFFARLFPSSGFTSYKQGNLLNDVRMKRKTTA
jgi:hypothetical protein